MRLGIFRAPNLAAANVAQPLLGAAWIPMWFFLNLYLQQVLGYAAFPSGAALLPMTVAIMLGMIGVRPALMARFGPKPLLVAGLAVLAGGHRLARAGPPRTARSSSTSCRPRSSPRRDVAGLHPRAAGRPVRGAPR